MADRIIYEIAAAEEEILFATYQFTHPGIATAVMMKAKENITVHGIVDQTYYSQWERMAHHDVDVSVYEGSGIMHHKFFCHRR